MNATSKRCSTKSIGVIALLTMATLSAATTQAQRAPMIAPTGFQHPGMMYQPMSFRGGVHPASYQQPGILGGCESPFCGAGGCGTGGYGTGGCGEGTCDSFGCDAGCCDGGCLDCDMERGGLFKGGARKALCRTRFFGEYLYLRSRDSEVAYAVPFDGAVVVPPPGPIAQIGPTEVVDINHSSGFRVGFSRIMDDCARITAQWAHYDSNVDDQVSVANPFLIRSLVTHPSTFNAASDGLNATAQHDVNFMLIDIAYENPFICCGRNHVEYFAGVRYGRLEQQFTSTSDTNNFTTVNTIVDFDGIGPRMGLFGKRNVGCVGLHFYGRGEASFLVGTFDASYVQQIATQSGPQVTTGWESGRIVSLLETELGFGWTGPCSRFRLTCGYLVSAWFNSVKTAEYINAVQQNDPDHLGDTLTFDGLRIRGELRF